MVINAIRAPPLLVAPSLPPPLPAIRHVYSWLKPPSLTLSQIGTQSDGERRDGTRLSCFIQFHYSVRGEVSVLTLLCQHSGWGSSAVIWLTSLAECQQCRVWQLIRCCQRAFACLWLFISRLNQKAAENISWSTCWYFGLNKQAKTSFFFGVQVLTPSLAIFCI